MTGSIVQCEPYFRLTIGSHYFKITYANGRMISVLHRFRMRFAQRDWKKENGKAQLKIIKHFGIWTEDNTEFRFHIGQLKAFYDFLKEEFIEPSFYETIIATEFEAAKIDAKLQSHFVLKDYQEQGRNFITQADESGNKSRLITFRTGEGKTLTGCAAICELKERTLICVLPKYTEKWAEDIVSNIDTKPKRVMMVKGGKDLKGLIYMAKENALDADYVVVSISTLQVWYRLHEKSPTLAREEYGCSPDELCELLETGTVIIDEVHEHLHEVYRFLCYTNAHLVIGLSATFLSLDSFLQKVQAFMFPAERRFENVNSQRYTTVYAVAFEFKDLKSSKIRTTEYGSNSYSQNAFEKSVLNNSKVKKNYLAMVKQILDVGYIQSKQEGDRAIVFANTIAMCSYLTEQIKLLYPDLDVRRYVEDDPYENILEADIRVTTIGSGGTAIDIKGLTCAVQTVNVQSPVSNLQAHGRLRNIPGRTVRFYYTYCPQLKKQREYHYFRKDLFKDYAKNIKDLRLPFAL